MRQFLMRCNLSLGIVLMSAGVVFGGMPTVDPLPYANTVMRLNPTIEERLQAVSFFLLGIAVSALVIRLLWNHLARDFPRLPKLSYAKALSLVVLWGLLFVIVLTMISGARELMTPGAWKPNGFTYTLDDDQPSSNHTLPAASTGTPAETQVSANRRLP